MTQIAKAHVHDPRNFERGYSPDIQADELQLAELGARLRDNTISFAEIKNRLKRRNLPPQVHNVPFVTTLDNFDEPVLLIPQNVHRYSFVIAAFDPTPGAPTPTLIDIWVSFGQPIPIFNPLFGFNTYGIELNTIAATFEETNGTITQDDLYVTLGPFGALGTIVLGYEGTLAYEANSMRKK